MKNQDQKPYVANYPALAEWLEKHEARCYWQEMDKHKSIEYYSIGKACAIVIIYADKRGWDIFTPCLNTAIKDTLDDAEKRLGLRSGP